MRTWWVFAESVTYIKGIGSSFSNWLNIPEVIKVHNYYNGHNQSFIFLILQKWAHAIWHITHLWIQTMAQKHQTKYSHLPKRKSLSLSSIASLLIDHFLPNMCIFQNFRYLRNTRHTVIRSIPSYPHCLALLHCY